MNTTSGITTLFYWPSGMQVNNNSLLTCIPDGH